MKTKPAQTARAKEGRVAAAKRVNGAKYDRVKTKATKANDWYRPVRDPVKNQQDWADWADKVVKAIDFKLRFMMSCAGWSPKEKSALETVLKIFKEDRAHHRKELAKLKGEAA